ncbi:collagen binding domain-containing protein [Paenibacillus sp. UMB7766-LJ446]|uniref:collagen binding domain-containing protein n=1 Tax=Paenibacillus sp. UMB7766-LJ446 TaxID=3046313 RepID=UPI00254D435F|nr:collagen binding domain-containing protein [Paenibacillus sp. UMB7766-LJ446]MDK8193642.1 collagen binding domain-containing protein [Paenibacillus sp. UMB7766-LJ446]
MNKKVSMVIIALLLITQMMQGWMFTPTMHAQDDMTAIVTMDTASEEGSVEPISGNDDNGPSMDSPESNESAEQSDLNSEAVVDPSTLALANNAAEVIKENLITSVQMYNQIPEYDGNGNMNIKGERIEDIRPSVKDEVAVVFTWGLPNDTHTYSDGSTFTFRLPDKFKIGSQLKGDLDGGVGEYVVNPDGEITFTFNDRIVGEKLEGNFYVWIKFDESKMDGGLKQPIDFSSVGQGIINVHFQNTAIDKLTKSGIANKNNFNSDEIEWTVDFNQGEKGINNAVLNDTLSAGPLKGNIEISELHIQLDGSVKEGSTVRTETQFPIALGNIDKAYRVKYTTSIKAPTTASFTNVLYENKVVLTGDQSEHDETDIGSVRVSFNEPLKKSGQESAYNPVTQTITWKVQYNYNQQEITQANAWIEDRFDTTKHELVDGSVKVHQVDIDGDGKPAGTTLVNSNEYTLTGVSTGFDDGFKLQFKNDITNAYEIEYQTKTMDRVYKDATVTNTVNMYDGTEKEGKKDIQEIIFAKSVQSEDFNTKEIEWKIVLNRDLKEMTDIVITDNYAGRHMKLKLIPGSLQISGDQKDQFELEPVADPSDINFENGFSIRLKTDGMINKEHVITYKTSFDPTAGMPTNNEYRNQATLNWKESNVPQASITKSAVVKPQDYTIQNGNKKGEYSAKDKTITWTIDVNYNLYDIQNAILKDAYTGNQSFVDGSLKVNKLTLAGANNVIAIGDEVALLPGQFQLNSDGKGFALNLGNIGKAAYRVVYKTSLDGDFAVEGTYSNHAVLTDGEGGEVRFEKSVNVTPEHGGVYVQKTGQQLGSSDKAAWTVNINPSQSYIAAGSVLTDTLSDNQILLADTLKLYATDLPANNSGNVSTKAGLVDAGEYELIVEGNTFIFTFKNEMKTAFILEYQSFINADSGERIGNKVEFAGQSSSVTGSDHQTGIRVSMAGAGGGASTGVGKMKIYKVDDTGLPLEGAIFAIYNASGTTLLETLKPTDVNGEVETSRKYRFNDQTNGLPYKLKELSAPNGYLIDPEYGASTGKTIDFKDPDQPFEIKNEKIRQGFELTKVDSVDSSKTLKGATFELYLKNGLSRDKIAELTTGDDGRIAKGNLEPGDYELIETEAPAYYQMDATPVPFTIAANQTRILTLSHTNVQGSGGKLVVTKVNAKGQSVLSGIEFELRDSKADVIDKKVTDLNGVIEFDSLPYGPYTLVETKAEGFVIEQPETAVTITKPVTLLTIENKKNDRSVKLIKYNSGKSQHLQGAVFELRAQSALMDANGVWEFKVVTGIDEAKLTTNSNGEIVLRDLEPNKYQLVEIKAPIGYRLDQTPVEFEITNKQTETVVVEKTNIAIPVPGGPSEPYNPGTPSTGTPNPGTSTPEPSTPDPSTPDPSTPDTTVPGTVVTPETSEPEDGTDQGTDPDRGESPSKPGDSTVVDEEDPSAVGNAGDAASPGADHTSSPADTNVAGAEEGKDGSFLGMLPKTGEERTWGYTLVGTLMIIFGSMGYLYLRRRQQMNP